MYIHPSIAAALIAVLGTIGIFVYQRMHFISVSVGRWNDNQIIVAVTNNSCRPITLLATTANVFGADFRVGFLAKKSGAFNTSDPSSCFTLSIPAIVSPGESAIGVIQCSFLTKEVVTELLERRIPLIFLVYTPRGSYPVSPNTFYMDAHGRIDQVIVPF